MENHRPIFTLKRQLSQNQSVTETLSEWLRLFPSANHDSPSSLEAFVLYKAGRNARSLMSLATARSEEVKKEDVCGEAMSGRGAGERGEPVGQCLCAHHA